jgi:hypothetical protein
MAVEAPNLEVQHHDLAESWKIGRMPDVSTMDSRAWFTAVRIETMILMSMGKMKTKSSLP